jgi:hypothetical protein
MGTCGDSLGNRTEGAKDSDRGDKKDEQRDRISNEMVVSEVGQMYHYVDFRPIEGFF